MESPLPEPGYLSALRNLGYSTEYEEVNDEFGMPRWVYRISKDGELIAASPADTPFPTKLDAELMAEELIMRLEQPDREAG